MTRLRVVAVASVSVALVAGAAGSPRLLEPGRSERDGIGLAPQAAANTGAASDWTYSPASTTVRQHRRSLSIRSHAESLQLLSRQLALVEGDCYTARVQFATAGGFELALLSATADVILQKQEVEASPVLRPATLEFVATRGRLTLAIVSVGPSVEATLGASTISPRPCDEPSGSLEARPH